MKREFLKDLGITDNNLIDKILDQVHTESTEDKAAITQLTNEKEALNQQVTQLQEKVSKFDGVDVEALKQDAIDLKEEYEGKITSMVKTHAVEKALATAKYPELLKTKIDYDKLTVDGSTVNGLDDQIKSLKETYSDFFSSKPATGYKPVDPEGNQPKVKTKEEILAITNRQEREKAIAENLELFTQ